MKYLRVLALLMSGLLFGFSDSTNFNQPTEIGGGGGYMFTGSPTSHGMGCAECHESLRSPEVLIESDPPGLFETGYEPDIRYQIFVKLAFETRGLEHNGKCGQGSAACNRNLFVAEFLDLTGKSTGILCPDVDPILGEECEKDYGEYTSRTPGGGAISGQSLAHPSVCSDENADNSNCIDVESFVAEGLSPSEITAEVLKHVRGQTEWNFSWRSPSVGKSPVRFYLGLVDGDGGTRVDPDYADYYGDGVYMTARLVPRSDTLVPADLTKAEDGCRSTPAIPSVALVLLAWLWLRRRTFA